MDVSVFHRPGCPWYPMSLSSMFTCEERLCHWIRQPANTLSSLAFFIVAYFLWREWRLKEQRTYLDWSLMSLFLGASSFMAHASQILIFSLFDYISQVLIFMYYFRLQLKRLKKNVPYYWATMMGLLIGLFFFQYYFKGYGVLLVSTFFGLCFGLELRFYLKGQGRYQYFHWVVGLSALGLLCFFADALKIFCYPSNHWLQLHAYWHFIIAGALYAWSRHCALNHFES